MAHRHTMGQDWGGRFKSNPKNIPKISSKMIFKIAKENNIEVKRGNYVLSGSFTHSNGTWSTWWLLHEDGKWRTLADTNYWAIVGLSEHLGKDLLKILTKEE